METTSKKDQVYGYVTERIIKQIEENKIVPWAKPWQSFKPTNFVTKKEYKGINTLLLAFSNFKSHFWLTLNQAKKAGIRIKYTEMANTQMIVFWNFLYFKKVNGVDVKVSANEQWDRKVGFLRYHKVYNMEQTENYIHEEKAVEPKGIEECESVWENYFNRPELIMGQERAFYRPISDTIGMPDKARFNSIEEFYSTFFHEMIHSTGSDLRIDRKLSTNFGDNEYSFEELVAEMGASFLCAEMGIENKTIDNSASYIANWLKALKNDKMLIVKAASAATKAVEYILNGQPKNAIEENEGELVTA